MNHTVQDAVFSPSDLHIIVVPEDVLQQIKEESPEEWSPGVNQQDPQPLHIKEELLTSMKKEQLNMKETDDIKWSFTAVPVKCEDDEEKPLFSQLHQHLMVDGNLPTSNSAAAVGGAETSISPDLNTREDDSSFSGTEVSENDEDWSSSDFVSKLLSDCESKTKDSESDRNESKISESGVNTVKTKVDLLSKEEARPVSHSCGECGETDLNKHRKIHTRQKAFGCDICLKRFSFKGNLNLHMRIHTEQNPFICGVCGQRLTCESKLNMHMRIHTGEKPFGCDVCDQKFSQKSNLNTHKRIHTGDRPFDCDVCDQKFTQKVNLIKHRSTHTEQKPFGCDICRKRFSIESSLNAHMRIHTQQNPFICDVCGQRLTCESKLNIHMRIHTGEKPFGCDVCNQKFTQKCNLNTHKRIHTGERLFCCSVCKKNVCSNNSLTNHMRIHTGQKPHGRDACEKMFSHKISLQTQTNPHTTEAIYLCHL